MGLDSVELMLEVEDEFKIRLSDPECEGVRTVADLVALVMAHLPRSAGAGLTAGAAAVERAAGERAVLERVRWLTARQLGIPIERVEAESRFVEDLEID